MNKVRTIFSSVFAYIRVKYAQRSDLNWQIDSFVDLPVEIPPVDSIVERMQQPFSVHAFCSNS